MAKGVFYYLVVFRIEGHERWRCHVAADMKSFEKIAETQNLKLLETKVYKVDRNTGNLVPHD